MPSRSHYSRRIHDNTLILEPQSSNRGRQTTNVTLSSFSNFTAKQSPKMSKTDREDMPIKGDNEYRIVSNNIGCIGIDAFVNHKQSSLKDWLIKDDIDIVGWQEIRLAQHMFPKHECLTERMRDYRRK